MEHTTITTLLRRAGLVVYVVFSSIASRSAVSRRAGRVERADGPAVPLGAAGHLLSVLCSPPARQGTDHKTALAPNSSGSGHHTPRNTSMTMTLFWRALCCCATRWNLRNVFHVCFVLVFRLLWKERNASFYAILKTVEAAFRDANEQAR